jgi:tRNA pseudouridine38-40 synthase
VQGTLRDAVIRFTGETVEVRGAGRTDAGVHATGQVAHLDLTRDWDPFVVREALNHHLKPAPVAVVECERASAGFDARFSAVRRHYLYRILTRRAPPVLDRNRVWWLPVALDAARMADAAQVLVGRWDFTTFRAAGCQGGSPVRTLDRLDFERQGEEIRVTASARSFLHHQIRSIVGSLRMVGDGRWTRADLEAARDACDRSRCGPVAPASGLYFTRVEYASATNSPTPADEPVADDEE